MFATRPSAAFATTSTAASGCTRTSPAPWSRWPRPSATTRSGTATSRGCGGVHKGQAHPGHPGEGRAEPGAATDQYRRGRAPCGRARGRAAGPDAQLASDEAHLDLLEADGLLGAQLGVAVVAGGPDRGDH